MRATALLITVAALTASPASAQPPRGPEPPTVVTNGRAIVKRAPDRAFVSFATETRASKPDQAQQDNARAMEKVRGELRDQKIPDEAVRTTSFNLREDVDWVNGKRVPRGYVVSNVIEVRVDTLDGLGSLLDQVVKAARPRSAASGSTSRTGTAPNARPCVWRWPMPARAPKRRRPAPASASCASRRSTSRARSRSRARCR